MTETPTIHQYLIDAQARLATAGVDNPALDARVLAAFALGVDRAALVTQGARELSAQEREKIEALIARRAAREPVGRILGRREFWGLDFELNEATLEPRPDSETLVEAALKKFSLPSPQDVSSPHRRESGGPGNESNSVPGPLDPRLRGDDTGKEGIRIPPRLLDLGTGTGCLLLSLLHEWPEATGLGIDLAPRAVEQAAANARRLGLADRAAFRVGNWLEGIDETFDVIVSNPPYIPSLDLSGLDPEVREHDPAAALDGGEDGLAPYRHLIPRLPARLNQNGVVLFELGIHQAAPVAALLREAGFQDVQSHNDLGGIARVVSGRR